ncbi:MAG TPA: pitrilysin family protein, partial [Gemmatimonadaceae bacterium]|nr:pitrilysin family protein [Gemmatimonadaceae bacterium]
KTVLPNGLTILVQEDRSAPVVAIVTYVKAGYFDETDEENGLSHALEHMFFKGTAKRGVGEIAKETKASGGYLNAQTIYDNTTYYTVLPSSGFAQGLEIQADAYANSIIDIRELAKEMEVIIQEAKRKSDNPSAVATETLFELLHDAHRMRRWRIGRESGLRAFTRDMMNGFYRNFYQPGNTILSISGDVDPADALRRATELYGDLKSGEPVRHPGPPEPKHDDFRYRELAGDIAQSQLVIGWRTPGTLDPDTAVLDVAASVLATGRASRLYRAVRERKLASSVSAYDYTPTEVGVFVVHAETEPENAAEAARVIWNQLHQLRVGGIEDDELTRVRRIFEARWVRRLETAEGRANYLAEWEALGGWALGDEYFRRYMSASADDIQRVVRKYLAEERAAAVIYRPENTSVVAQDAADMKRMLGEGGTERLPAIPRRAATAAPEAKTAELEKEEAGVSVFRTEEKVPVLVRRKPGTPMVNIGVFIVGGAIEEEPEHAGLTLLTVRTMLKGTATRSAAQIAEDAEMLGGSISASAGSESFGWSLSVPATRLAEAVELLGDVIQRPTIPDDAFEIERTVALSNVAMLRDDMYRYPMRLASSVAFAKHPYGTPPMGTEDSLRAITAEQAREWHKSRVLESAAVVGIVADLEQKEVADIVARELSLLQLQKAPKVGTPRWPKSVKIAAESRDKAQTAIALAFPAPARDDESRFAASLIATVASGLGGRFFEELRDKQSLAYTVQAAVSERRLAGMFLSYIATSPEKEGVARAGLLAEFAKLRDVLVSDEELARAKEYVVGSHAISQESGAAQLGEMLDAWMFGEGLNELLEYDTRIRAVTAEQMREVAREYFDAERRVEGIVRGVGRTV